MRNFELNRLYNGIGILPGNQASYIDHLVPLCHLLKIPILVTDVWIQALIEWHYPPLDVIYVEASDYNLDPFLNPYDLFVYVDYFRKGNGTFQFQEYTCSKKARSLMSLHGHPDKFLQIYWLENLCDEEIVLVYGSQLKNLLEERGIQKQTLVCGNYRLEFYKQHEDFFDLRLPFQKKKTTLLYAPTWSVSGRLTEHRHYFSPFFDLYRKVFDTLSDDYQLIVKLHPHMIKKNPDSIERMKEEYPQIYFLQDYPPIYPLLKQVDLYLGDYSSIGYDFLYFNRPLFFLETKETTPLQSYGTRITLQDLSKLKAYEKRESQAFYHSVFSQKELDVLHKEIENAYRHPSS